MDIMDLGPSFIQSKNTYKRNLDGGNATFLKFNPFRQEKYKTNEIMTTYSSSNYNLNTKRPLKTILFWNDAYGSKDYG